MPRRGSYRANVLRLDDVDPDGFPNSDPAFHDNLILAEGDSWFSIGGFPPTNLVYGLRFKRQTMVVSCAKLGDTIVKMSQMANNNLYKRALSNHGYAWDLILLSGGGNDLIDEAKNIVRPRDQRQPRDPTDAEGYIKKTVRNDLLRKIKKRYRDLAAVRDRPSSLAKGKPIVTHTYDYATPRNEPARFVGVPVLGPWLYDALVDNDVREAMWIPVAKHLIDSLADAIISLQTGSNPIDHFHVVDTRGTLTPPKTDDVGPTTHWLNEIHPNHDGYSKVAKKIEAEKLYPLLYGP